MKKKTPRIKRTEMTKGNGVQIDKNGNDQRSWFVGNNNNTEK